MSLNIEKYKDKGLSGLCNLGNTCFINSCIQVLSHTYEINNFLSKETYKTKLNKVADSILLIEWDNLRQIMWNDNCVISPGKFIRTVQKVAEHKKMDMFTGFAQNDLQEFFLFLVDCFHNSLCREIKITISGEPKDETDQIAIKCFEMIKNMYSKEYSEFWNLFYAIHVSEIRCLKTGELMQQTPEPFFMVNLPIPPENKSPSLIDCFDLYIQGEKLVGDDAWFNEKINEKMDIQKKIQFWSFPTILAIDLKRFNAKNQKNQILVTFPLENLDLSPYVIGYKKSSYIYDLYGVCNHSGSVYGGHYTAYVKNANGKWYHYNDTSVTEVDRVEHELISPKAYVLFYRKRQ